MDKVEKLVEQIAKIMQDRDNEAGECYACWDESAESTHIYYRETAKQILSHPDLALIESDQALSESVKEELGYSRDIDKGQLSLIHNGWKKVIPLAEHLKEVKG